MRSWVISFAVSFVAILVMVIIFQGFSLVALNGFMSMSAAMPTYLVFNAIAWPIIVGMGTAVTLVIFAIAKQKKSIWHIILLNAILVTLLLGAFILLASFS